MGWHRFNNRHKNVSTFVTQMTGPAGDVVFNSSARHPIGESVLASTNATVEDRADFNRRIGKLDDYYKVRKNVIYERARFNCTNVNQPYTMCLPPPLSLPYYRSPMYTEARVNIVNYPKPAEPRDS